MFILLKAHQPHTVGDRQAAALQTSARLLLLGKQRGQVFPALFSLLAYSEARSEP